MLPEMSSNIAESMIFNHHKLGNCRFKTWTSYPFALGYGFCQSVMSFVISGHTKTHRTKMLTDPSCLFSSWFLCIAGGTILSVLKYQDSSDLREHILSVLELDFLAFLVFQWAIKYSFNICFQDVSCARVVIVQPQYDFS